jgi:hypothetical protein
MSQTGRESSCADAVPGDTYNSSVPTISNDETDRRNVTAPYTSASILAPCKPRASCSTITCSARADVSIPPLLALTKHLYGPSGRPSVIQLALQYTVPLSMGRGHVDRRMRLCAAGDSPQNRPRCVSTNIFYRGATGVTNTIFNSCAYNL